MLYVLLFAEISDVAEVCHVTAFFFESSAVRYDAMAVGLVIGIMMLIEKSTLASLARGHLPIRVLASQYSIANQHKELPFLVCLVK